MLWEQPEGHEYPRWFDTAYVSDGLWYHADIEVVSRTLRGMLEDLSDDQIARALMAPWIDFASLKTSTPATSPTKTPGSGTGV